MTKAKNIILAIGIAILFVMFVAYAIESFYPSPSYDDFCGEFRSYDNPRDCEESGGRWNENGVKPVEGNVTGFCEVDFYCRQDYGDAEEIYSRDVFFISIVVGLIVIVVSVLLKKENVSSGFMAGGFLLVIYGTIRYWGSLSDVWRTLMLGFALAVLVWIGYKKLK